MLLTQCDEKVGILQHFHVLLHYILREEVCAYKTSLTSSLFTKVPEQIVQSCRVRVNKCCLFFYDLSIRFRILILLCGMFCFHLLSFKCFVNCTLN